jgi:predicted DNA repair protein MutK
MTLGVYGLVAGIVKLDDLGLHLMLKKGQSLYKQLLRKIGVGLLAFAPKLMRFLSVAGTAAMFLVGGSIIGHGVLFLNHLSESIAEIMGKLPVVGSILATISPIIIDGIIGLIVGAICVALFEIAHKLMRKK